MLLQRVLTALVLVPLVVAGVLLASRQGLALVFGGFVLLGAREMARLGGLRAWPVQAGYVGVVGLCLLALYLWPDPVRDRWLQLGAICFWLPASLVLFAWRRPLEAVAGVRPLILVLGAAQLVVAWLAVMALHGWGGQGPALLLFLLVLIWVADSGAYFAGRAFGRHKLSPQVSPGKTWEGAAGGLAGAVLCGLAFDRLGLAPVPLLSLLGLCLLTTLVSIGGDLWESLLKRQVGLKDSGTLLPGHGGVLDRIDSLIAAAPLFALGLQWLETPG
ncbi:phosphatidate cytidylyltransferase [endosymbiont of unidentified scaly snail isolate Monju]|uniref:phosphatidate cytidylyltransferase n=1 Tax=endosymbiont of unidentified scaly snail isolate Monju TaxID=1248727 RepID=UPI000389279C|nr:phosphatidate cytidylyltransferase [endosymbiont of unidentified scaly snail isolate Monju]BAN68669.1 phosphatidate cytidylyltransferase [endosymbiont of unidentified scaly snail isolate Monju]